MKTMRKLMITCILAALFLLCVVPVAAETSGWVKSGSAYKWKQEDGSFYTKSGWQTLGGKLYYLNKDGSMKTGWITYGGKKYYLSKSSNLKVRGTKLTGKKKIGTKYYYFSSKTATLGQLQYGAIKTGGKYYYFDKNAGGAMLINTWKSSYYYGSTGARLTGLNKIGGKYYYLGTDGKKVTSKYGIKVGKTYYKINASGVCTKVSEVMGLAGIQLEKIGMGKDLGTNMKKAFDWSAKKILYRNVAAPSAGKNAAEYYAVYGFKTNPGKGDCNVQAATFCYMAKVLGYTDMEYIKGQVWDRDKATNKNVKKPHAWCEIKVNGVYYFFDPNSAQSGNVGWNFRYGTKNSLMYIDEHNHTK